MWNEIAFGIEVCRAFAGPSLTAPGVAPVEQLLANGPPPAVAFTDSVESLKILGGSTEGTEEIERRAFSTPAPVVSGWVAHGV